MNLDHVNWISRPPQRRIQVYRVRPRNTIRVIAAGPGLALRMHPSLTGLLPCCCWPPPTGRCHAEGVRPVSYLPAVCSDSRPILLELVGEPPDKVPLLSQPGLAGRWVKVRQPASPPGERVQVEILLELPRACNVVPFDPLPRLLAVWAARAAGEPDPDDQAAMLHALEGGPTP